MGENKKNSAISDLLLWKELCGGNELAFQEVYNLYVQDLYDYGVRFSQDEELIKDCIQELFVDIYRKRNSLGKTDNIKFYLLKSLKRKIFRALKKNNKIVYVEITEMPFSVSGSIEDLIVENEKKDEVQTKLLNALEKLSPRQKEAIFLRFNEGLEYTEICEIMEVDYQSVRNLIFRAVSKLRELMPGVLLLNYLLSQRFYKFF